MLFQGGMQNLGAAREVRTAIYDAFEVAVLGNLAKLMHEFVEHPDIDTGVKRRLWQLAPPLLMLTLQGGDYLEAELEAARYHPLTGLLDRAALRTRLESALRQCVDGGAGPAVCLVAADPARGAAKASGDGGLCVHGSGVQHRT